MPKSHYDYNVYTPALIAELRDLVAGLPRAEGVKRLAKRLDISDRNARRQYVKYVEGDIPAEFIVALDDIKHKRFVNLDKVLSGAPPNLPAWTQPESGFSADLLKIAKDTGQSFDIVGKAAAELARQGLSKKDLLKRLKDALILSRLAGTDVTKSVRELRAAIQQMPAQSLTEGRPIRRLFLDLETSPKMTRPYWPLSFPSSRRQMRSSCIMEIGSTCRG